jgi:hypothetical protein
MADSEPRLFRRRIEEIPSWAEARFEYIVAGVEKSCPIRWVLSVFRQAFLIGTLAFAVAPASWASQETGAASSFSPRDQFRGALHFLAPQHHRRPTAAFRKISPNRGTLRLSRAGPAARRLPYARYGYRTYGYSPYGYLQRGYPRYGYLQRGYPRYSYLVAVSPYDPYRAYRYVYYYRYYPYRYPYFYRYPGY